MILIKKILVIRRLTLQGKGVLNSIQLKIKVFLTKGNPKGLKYGSNFK